MNEAQKKIMIAVAIGLVIAFLFPPHAFFREGGGVIQMGYSFIANMPQQKSVHIPYALRRMAGYSNDWRDFLFHFTRYTY
ncbi:MAG: hypothetical protein PHD43_13625 [Methylococcales bacterium]|nr:hypothetical protein [Methylococcales bacterium]